MNYSQHKPKMKKILYSYHFIYLFIFIFHIVITDYIICEDKYSILSCSYKFQALFHTFTSNSFVSNYKYFAIKLSKFN